MFHVPSSSGRARMSRCMTSSQAGRQASLVVEHACRIQWSALKATKE